VLYSCLDELSEQLDDGAIGSDFNLALAQSADQRFTVEFLSEALMGFFDDLGDVQGAISHLK
jgi:hypothetical protein